jgi:hypothetical protein
VLGLISPEEDFNSKIFVGAKVAIQGINGLGEAPEIFKICFFHDFLPSVAADIALLPVTLVYEVFRKKTPPKAALPPTSPGQEQRKERRRKGRRRRFS